MDSWTIINIVLNAITVFNLALTIIISIGILSIILIFHRRTRSVPILLASHTCLAILLSAIVLATMIISSLLGFLGIHLYEHDNTIWCLWSGFLVHGFLCALYDAYGLQAIFRFLRVVFYQRRIFHSFQLYCILIPFDILFAVVCISPVLIWHDVVYLPSEFYCQTPFINLPAILYVAMRLYAFPLFGLFGIYWYLVRYIRRTSLLADTVDARRRAHNNVRDLIVIKRLLIIVVLLILLGLPSIIFMIMFIFTGHLLSITYRIGWLFVSFSLVLLVFLLIRYTVPLRQTVKRLIGVRQRHIVPQ
jgi:hypothetical protein